MNSCELVFKISAIANAISSKLTTDELNLLATIVTQLGDTLNTIAAQRTYCDSLNNKSTDTNANNTTNTNKT